MSGIFRTLKFCLVESCVSDYVSYCLSEIRKMPFYAVAKGRSPGIYHSWADCEAQVKGFSGAKFKKFDTESGANDFIKSNSGIGGFAKVSSYSQSQSKSYNKSSSNNNLKRSYSTSSKTKNSDKKSSSRKNDSFSDVSESDSSGDELDVMLSKQMDDIEKRLSTFSKGIDKITKAATKGVKKTILIEPVLKKHKRNESNFEVDNEGYVQVYTDGACSANGKLGARAGLGVYWGEDHSLNRSEPVSGRATNNCGEIQAATLAIKTAIQNGVNKLTINTDSQFLIKAVTEWIPGWKRRGWKLASGEPVKNEIDFKDLDSVKDKIQVKWNYVKAHNGQHGNEMADRLAKAGAAMYVL